MENGYQPVGAYPNNNQHSQPDSDVNSSSSLPKNLLLTRGFSRVQANEEILNETRSQIENSLCKSHDDDSTLHIINELPDYSFMLPDLNKFDDYRFKEYLQNDLIELPTQYALTESGHLNWWCQNDWEHVNRPLYPMVTSGDGNCLLHAASLAMWGLHDRYLILRKALHSTLEHIKENSSALWRRWKWEQMGQNRKYGLIYSDEEWSREWKSLLKLSSYQPRVAHASKRNNGSSNAQTSSSSSNGQQINTNKQASNKLTQSSSTSSTNSSGANSSSSTGGAASSSAPNGCINDTNLLANDGQVYFESLEEFHILLLAHILQRPIIVVADTMLHDLDGEPLSPVNFSGIYLPFECELNKCHRYPLVLAYDSAHFSALVLMDNEHLEDYDLLSKESMATVGNPIRNIVDIDKINKRTQNKHPYAVIPLTYANKELLPVHFGYDPGPDYDWSKFPLKPHQYQNANLDEVNIQNAQVEYELGRDEKMFLIQRYLDVVKMQLYDPGPTVKRNAQIAVNSSGMRVNISNVKVNEPERDLSSTDSANRKTLKHTKSTVNTKIQKFLNMFKRTSSKDKEEAAPGEQCNGSNGSLTSKAASKLRKSIKMANGAKQAALEHGKQPGLVESRPASFKLNNELDNFAYNFDTVFHKQVTYKTWTAFFDSTIHYTCLLCVKLNLAKPPKFNRIIANYIDSAQHKYDAFKQQQQQQQQVTKNRLSNEAPPHYCVVNKNDCSSDNLCSNCTLNSSLRSMPVNSTTGNSLSSYSYNHAKQMSANANGRTQNSNYYSHVYNFSQQAKTQSVVVNGGNNNNNNPNGHVEEDQCEQDDDDYVKSYHL